MNPVAKETVLERIRRQVAIAIRAGKFETEAQFLRAAGIKSDGFFGELEKRTRENPSATMRADTAAKIASVLGISVDDLMGSGAPDEPPLVDVYPNRAWAVKSARDMDLPEAAIQLVLKYDPGRDLQKLAWFHRIEAEADALRPTSGRDN